jgi:hypothetical protein
MLHYDGSGLYSQHWPELLLIQVLKWDPISGSSSCLCKEVQSGATHRRLRKIFYSTNTIASPAWIASGLVPLVQNCATARVLQALLEYVGKIANKRVRPSRLDIGTICNSVHAIGYPGNPK